MSSLFRIKYLHSIAKQSSKWPRGIAETKSLTTSRSSPLRICCIFLISLDPRHGAQQISRRAESVLLHCSDFATEHSVVSRHAESVLLHRSDFATEHSIVSRRTKSVFLHRHVFAPRSATESRGVSRTAKDNADWYGVESPRPFLKCIAKHRVAKSAILNTGHKTLHIVVICDRQSCQKLRPRALPTPMLQSLRPKILRARLFLGCAAKPWLFVLLHNLSALVC